MHYGIVAIGSRGDVQPFVGLGLGLINHGHTVTLMAHENFKTFVEGYGLEFHPLPGNIEEMLYTPEAKQVLRKGNMLSFMRFVQKIVAGNQTKVNTALLKGAEKADVLVTSLLGMIWVDAIAESRRKKWAAIQLSFPSTPTGEFPFALLDFFNFGLYNRWTYQVFDYLYTKDYKKQLNEFRQSLGLEPVEGSILKKMAAEKNPNIYALSPALLPRPKDWDDRSQLTGFIDLPAKNREQNPADEIPETLKNWLASGEKPVYMGFGSMPIPDPKRFIHVLEQLLNQTTYRFIFCQGWSYLDNLPKNPRLFVVTAIDHSWLFPGCKAAIIHGGIGTIATALKAGLPLIIASIVADQPWWGKLIEKRGLGVHLPFRKWTTENVLAAIRKTETKDVTAISSQINKEDGLEETIRALEKYFK